MTSNESILTEQVRQARRRENWFNILKFVLVCVCVVLLVSGLTAVLRPNDTGGELFFAFLIALLVLSVDFLAKFVGLFWPFILYFWAEVWTVRQRTLLTLVQTAAETKTPLAEMIHAYAAGCVSSGFRSRLKRFAAMLEQGTSLDEAISRAPGLFRYDVVSMLHLGGNDPATLRSMESSINDERDYSPIRSMSIVRVAYFITIFSMLFSGIAFMMFAIVPAYDKIFVDFESDLPRLTQLVISAAQFFVLYWYVCAPAVPLIGVLFIVFLIVQTGIIVWRPPFFRRMFREADSAKMLRILSVGLKQNVPISRVLQVYRYTVPSTYLRCKALQIENDVEKGRSWMESLRRQRVVSAAEASLLETAGRTGNISTVLHQLSGSKERSQLRKDDLTNKLVFIPCLFAIAAVVGVFVIAMFLPLVALVTAMSHY